jgi:hypothetical protein
MDLLFDQQRYDVECVLSSAALPVSCARPVVGLLYSSNWSSLQTYDALQTRIIWNARLNSPINLHPSESPLLNILLLFIVLTEQWLRKRQAAEKSNQYYSIIKILHVYCCSWIADSYKNAESKWKFCIKQ